MTKTRHIKSFKTLCLAVMVLFSISACASFYHFSPLSHPDPEKLPIVVKIPGSGLTVGLRSYHTAQDIHELFGHSGLWREHILPILLVVKESNSNFSAQILEHSTSLSLLNLYYRSIPPSQAFDIAWQANVPYIDVKQVLYYTGLIIFTIVTLGLGSMIWVLPSPFSQPTPQSDPFGRDLSYKAYPINAVIHPDEKLGGLLYFNFPIEEGFLNRTSLFFQVQETSLDKKIPPKIINVHIPLSAKKKSKVNPVLEILHGFF